MLSSRTLFVLAGPTIFLFMLFLLEPPVGMSDSAYAVLASTIWIAIWWITEAVPIPVTSLLPLVLFPLCNIMPIDLVAESYSKPIIFLFLGGFLIALAMEKWDLHKRIALTVISRSGTNMRRVLLGFMVATWFLSMWISNTATVVMMLPIALSIIFQFDNFKVKSGEGTAGAEVFGKALVLSLAYSASIGGMATLVGTPTNLIFAESVHDFYGVQIPFDQWMWIGLPVSVVLLCILFFYLTRVYFNISKRTVKGAREFLQAEMKVLGPVKPEEKWVLAIFSLVAVAWVTRRYIITPFFPAVNDTNIVLIGAILLFLIPSPSNPRKRIMDWKTGLKVPWGVLILFGGALSVASGFERSGLTIWIGDQLGLLTMVPYWLILLIVVAVINFLTEITQNMATCTLMMPIMAAFALVLDVHPFGLMTAAAIASSCAFMLPVATAPNAVVFGSGLIRIKDMARAGIMMNILSIIIVTFFIYFLFPYIWGIDLLSFPEMMK